MEEWAGKGLLCYKTNVTANSDEGEEETNVSALGGNEQPLRK